MCLMDSVEDKKQKKNKAASYAAVSDSIKSADDFLVWHRKLGHPNNRVLKQVLISYNKKFQFMRILYVQIVKRENQNFFLSHFLLPMPLNL